MDFKLHLLPDFELDVDEVYKWYEQNVNEELSLKFIDDLLEQLTFIEIQPKTLTKYKNNIRKINLKKFPYKILFKVQGYNVIVFALFHHKQNPKPFIKRKT